MVEASSSKSSQEKPKEKTDEIGLHNTPPEIFAHYNYNNNKAPAAALRVI